MGAEQKQREAHRQTGRTHTACCPRYVIAAGHSEASQGRGLARLLASARLPARHVSRQTDSSRRLRKHGSTVMETTGAPPSGRLCLSLPALRLLLVCALAGLQPHYTMHTCTRLQERERERGGLLACQCSRSCCVQKRVRLRPA